MSVELMWGIFKSNTMALSPTTSQVVTISENTTPTNAKNWFVVVPLSNLS